MTDKIFDKEKNIYKKLIFLFTVCSVFSLSEILCYFYKKDNIIDLLMYFSTNSSGFKKHIIYYFLIIPTSVISIYYLITCVKINITIFRNYNFYVKNEENFNNKIIFHKLNNYNYKQKILVIITLLWLILCFLIGFLYALYPNTIIYLINKIFFFFK